MLLLLFFLYAKSVMHHGKWAAGSHLGLTSALKGFSEIKDIKGDGAFGSAGKNSRPSKRDLDEGRAAAAAAAAGDIKQMFQSLMEKQV